MEREQGVIGEVLTQLRAIHGTVERIEQLLARNQETPRGGARRLPAENGAGQAPPPGVKLGASRSQLLTVGQVAALLGQSVATIRKWGYLRQIETIRLGRSVRISTAEVERLIARNRRLVAKKWREESL
jgi:excisionase family DNA binding protein